MKIASGNIERHTMNSLIFITAKNLLHNKVSLVLMLVAVSAGVGLQIPNSANLNGYSHALFEKGILQSVGHIVITSGNTEAMDDIDVLMQTIHGYSFVEHAVARYTHGAVLYRKNQHTPVFVTGLNFPKEQAANGFCNRIIAGSCPPPNSKHNIVLGHGVAEKIGAVVGDRVRLYVPYQELGEVKYKKSAYNLIGILQGGGFSAVDHGVFIALHEMYSIIGWQDTATSVHLFLNHTKDSKTQTAKIKNDLSHIQVRSWHQIDEFVHAAITGNQTISAVSMTMTILAVLVPILALLYIQVISEKKQIATLMAIGLDRRHVLWLFLLRAVIVSVIGIIFGLVLAYFLCRYFTQYPLFSYRGFHITPKLDLEAIMTPVITIYCVTVLGGLIPAIMAARTDSTIELKSA